MKCATQLFAHHPGEPTFSEWRSISHQTHTERTETASAAWLSEQWAALVHYAHMITWPFPQRMSLIRSHWRSHQVCNCFPLRGKHPLPKSCISLQSELMNARKVKNPPWAGMEFLKSLVSLKVKVIHLVCFFSFLWFQILWERTPPPQNFFFYYCTSF